MKKVIEPYLKIPDHILSIRDLGPGEKMLLAHICSFGVKGCWQSNETMGQIFATSARTIQRWLRGIRPYISIGNGKGYYRTIWAKNLDKNGMVVRQNASSDSDKSGPRVRQNCRTTIINTITGNNERTIASPTPLPAAGQASATLAHRRQVSTDELEKFKALLGRAKVGWTPLSPEQFEKRRAEQIAALRNVELRIKN